MLNTLIYNVLYCRAILHDVQKISSVLVGVELNQSVSEGALLLVQQGGWSGLSMSDNSLFGNLFSTTASNVSSLHPKCKHRASLSNQFIPSLGVTSSDAAHPAHFNLPRYNRQRKSPTFCCTSWRISTSSRNKACSSTPYVKPVLAFQFSLLLMWMTRYLYSSINILAEHRHFMYWSWLAFWSHSETTFKRYFLTDHSTKSFTSTLSISQN